MSVNSFEKTLFDLQFGKVRRFDEYDEGIWPTQGLVRGLYAVSRRHSSVFLPMLVRWEESPAAEIDIVTLIPGAQVMAHVVRFAAEMDTVTVRQDMSAHDPSILEMRPEEQYQTVMAVSELRDHPLGVRALFDLAGVIERFAPEA